MNKTQSKEKDLQTAPIANSDEYWLNQKDNKEKIARGLSAFIPLDDAFMSIAARLHIIRKAKHTLDLQYYIWNNDVIGQLLLSELLQAADRGVKIRLLIDDQNGTQLDPYLKQLAVHPNIQIKIFNPYKFRSFKIVDYLFRLKVVNHRMHNKLIIGDGIIAVTGGRNISREYFDASEDFQFVDLDILFYGFSAIAANSLFQEFWTDDFSHSIQNIIGEGSKNGLEKIRKEYALNQSNTNMNAQKIIYAEQIIREFLTEHDILWAKTHFIGDSPNKVRGKSKTDELIYNQFIQIMGEPKKHMELVSAYFVPQKAGLDYLINIQNNQANVRIVTNSFLANDVPIVHSFYQKYRKPLLASGVKIYEFKPYIERYKRTWYEVLTGNVIPAKNKNASRLHAKFFDIDGMVFIGSFNFDPRSAYLNTEVGLVIESDQLQDYVQQTLDEYLPEIAYELKLNEQGEIEWIERLSSGEIVIHKVEPETTKFQRFIIKLVSYLPIEWLM